MDDFLHNLRSGKLKQVDRSNRSYNDQQFKGGPRRNLDRRKPHYENKDSEKLSAIKEVLETLVESQKQLTEAYHARTRAEERKARAMEVLAKNLYRMLNPNANDADDIFKQLQGPEAGRPAETTRRTPSAPVTVEPQAEDFIDEVEPAEVSAQADQAEEDDEEFYSEEAEGIATEDTEGSAGEDRPERLSTEDRRMLVELIQQMRSNGQGWEKIARNIAAQGIPTISGKGSWRGVMVKNLFEKMAPAS